MRGVLFLAVIWDRGLGRAGLRMSGHARVAGCRSGKRRLVWSRRLAYAAAYVGGGQLVRCSEQCRKTPPFRNTAAQNKVAGQYHRCHRATLPLATPLPTTPSPRTTSYNTAFDSAA
ncbi:hypothetical protein BPORC_1766 [Bifidobacterium porcinum]|nr:hypothetical protein BPORC_1766 [Bifidobacterium porcinum]